MSRLAIECDEVYVTNLIVGKINDEWLKGELEERTGIFPTSFVASQP